MDIERHLTADYLNKEFGVEAVVATSVKFQAGLDEVEKQISDLFFAGIEDSNSTVMVTNSRQVGLLQQAKNSLNEVIQGIEDGMPIDLVQIDMTNGWDKLGEITGESAPDELITQLFSQFCLGK